MASDLVRVPGLVVEEGQDQDLGAPLLQVPGNHDMCCLYDISMKGFNPAFHALEEVAAIAAHHVETRSLSRPRRSGSRRGSRSGVGRGVHNGHRSNPRAPAGRHVDVLRFQRP